MNIHGYKQKSKNITILLKRELKKSDKDQSPEKIKRLKRAKKTINSKIKALKDARPKKK